MTASTPGVTTVPAASPSPIPQRLTLVLPSTGAFDSRTYRIASTCARRGHTVTVIARSDKSLPGEELHAEGYRILRVDARASKPLPPVSSGIAARGMPLVRRVRNRLVRALAIVLVIRAQTRSARRVAPPADLYHGMAYMGIPVAMDLAKRDRAQVVYDARDIYVDAANLARGNRVTRWLVGVAERRWARRVGRVITVNQPYAEVMASRWGVAFPAVVLNCSYRTNAPEPPERRFHQVLGLPPERRVVLYHGGFSHDRGIEQLIEAIADVPDAVLVLLGYGSLETELRATAATAPHAGRVFVLPAVAPTDLLAWVGSADVVAMPIQPTTLNHRLTTPNKLFEAMASGTPIVASDLPGMAGIVRETGAGRLVDPTSPTAIAAAIRELLALSPEERTALRGRILAAAHDTYNWERQAEILLAEYGRLTGKPW